MSWDTLKEGSVDNAIDFLYDKLDDLMHAYIPRVQIDVIKSSLPWLNKKCRSAIERKHQAEGEKKKQGGTARVGQVVSE